MISFEISLCFFYFTFELKINEYVWNQPCEETQKHFL